MRGTSSAIAGMATLRALVVAGIVVVFAGLSGAVTLPGGGPKKSDCLVVLMTNGVGFPAAGALRGATCADGDVCDGDGQRNGACLFTPMVCVNTIDAGNPSCSAAQVSTIGFKGKVGKTKLDTAAFDGAVAGLGLPTGATACSIPVDLPVPVGGPNIKGEFVRGTAEVRAKAKTAKGTDKDTFAFTCLPGVGPGATSTSTSSSTTTSTSTSNPDATTSTTTSTLPAGVPGAGLHAEITGVTISAAGQVVVTFTLTDDAGVPITPVPASTTDPNQARARFAIARIDVGPKTVDLTQEFTHYVNYLTNASGLPTYDSGATASNYVLTDVASGTWTYTFNKKIPLGFPTDLTHTVGAQIQRTYAGEALVANPTLDFVPNGSAVTTVREDVETAQCNACHNPLQAHGGGRREVKLCVLCHTQGSASNGTPIDFKNMVHRIHRGKDLPSVTDGPVGARYGFTSAFGTTTFAEKVMVCVGGPSESAPCELDADCGSGGTCSGEASEGVAFPQDLRNCEKCHSGGSTAAHYKTQPSAAACTGCHDDVNPSEEIVGDLQPGEGHLAGPQPDTYCNLCHKDTADDEFDITIPGAHTIPTRSATLAGLQGDLVSATATPGNPVQVQFRIRDGAGTALTTFAGFGRIAFAISGSTRDYGASTVPLIAPTAFGGGATGTLTGPDGTGLATYTTAASLPADAVGTWTVGMEARRGVTVNGQTVNEALANPVLDFSVDGGAVVARRDVVDGANCAHCHGTFSKDFSIHGNLRNNVEYCVICHNPNGTDFGRRKNAVAFGADPNDQSIDFKHLIHKIHRGENLEQQPYIVNGFGAAPKNYTAHNFGEVRFPGDLRDCETCHAKGTNLLPLPSGVLPTVHSQVSGGLEVVVGHIGPITDACTSCHDDDAVAAHAETMTTASGAEACVVCHGEGSIAAVSEVHAR